MEKWQLALDMLDETRSWGIEVPLAVADAGYGDAAAFRHGLQARGLHHVVGISTTLSAQPGEAVPVAEPYSGTGRPPVEKYPDKPQSVKQLVIAAGRKAARGVQWREGSRPGTGRSGFKRICSRFVALRIRDQCYAGQAVAAAGPHPLLDHAVRFVSARLHEHGPRLAPAYTAAGGPVPDQRTLDLPGFPGGYDRVGNWVNRQFQLDVFGEALLLFAAAHRHGRLDADSWRAAEIAADAISHRRCEADAGIWELDNRAWTHSRLICAAGLRAVADAVPSANRAAQWAGLADAVVADTSATSLHPSGRWQRSPQVPAVDAALLLPPLRGALPAAGPRTVHTQHAYSRDLTNDYYAYRFRHDERPLEVAEGAFLLCGYVMALAEHQQGHEAAALRCWFERNRAACRSPGLYAEEYDIAPRQLRGNLPQAFVHALLLETSTRLAAPWRTVQRSDRTERTP
ncbi:transposase [Streptomyces sp. NPDC047515]|uniref:transposase n=1 Tax=Streptomyces sp. NPDC047515 TaxID=3155380 RepID=UPI0033DA2948